MLHASHSPRCCLLTLRPPGDITASELGHVMRKLGLNPSNEELDDLVNEVDLNKDGVISFDGLFFWPLWNYQHQLTKPPPKTRVSRPHVQRRQGDRHRKGAPQRL